MPDRVGANVDTLHVTADTSEVEGFVVAQPDGLSVSTIMQLVRACGQVDRLIFEAIGTNLLAALLLHVEKVEMGLRGASLSRHLVFIGFQRGAGLGGVMHYPQLLHVSLVSQGRHEIASVWRPVTVDIFPFMIQQRIGIHQVARHTEGEMRHSIRG